MNPNSHKDHLGSSILTPESLSEATPARCSDSGKCSPDARYDQIAYGAYSATLKCRLCGGVIRHDWD